MTGLPSYTILAVDGESKELEELFRLLKEQRHRADRVDSLEEADRFLQKERVDAVLFEPLLSDDRGRLFIDRLRKAYAEPPAAIIVLTEEPDPDRRIELLEMDIDDLILKPFHPREAMARLEVILGRIRPLLLSEDGKGEGLSGSLAEMGVADLIQTVIIAEKSATIHLQHKTETAHIEIQKGAICGIRAGRQSNPIEALLTLLTWEEGKFSIEFRRESGKTEISPDEQRRISKILHIVSLLRETMGEPFSLQTRYVAHSSNLDQRLSQAERSVLLLFLEPASIRRALALSSLEAEQVLQCVYSLISKGLLLKTVEHQRVEEERPVFTPISAIRRGGTKQQYGRIFSLFRQGAPLKSRRISPFELLNRPQLSKAELMLIRQKFSQ